MNYKKNEGGIIIIFAAVLLVLIGVLLYLVISFDAHKQSTKIDSPKTGYLLTP